MNVEQFVMAYRVEQDRIRAILPEGYESLRPVLRINAEIRSETNAESGISETVYIEVNTPVAAFDKRGWLNIANWESPKTEISYARNGKTVSFCCPFLEIAYTGVGIEGGCPAEKDNDGCFFIGNAVNFVPKETINCNKEFCDCQFQWKFAEGNAHGKSVGGKSIAALPTAPKKQYDKLEFCAQTAAQIECEEILGSYVVRFER